MPSFVLPGATYNLYTAGHVLKALDFVDEDEEIEEELALVSAEYVDNLDIVGLLEFSNPEFLPMYFGAREGFACKQAGPSEARAGFFASAHNTFA